MSEKKQRLTFITIAQVFSMILIVLSHSVPSTVSDGSWMTKITPYLQLCGLPVFMTLSGFLVSYTKQLEKYGYKGFIRRRTVRLLVPYFVVSVLMLIPKFLIGKLTGVPVSLKVSDLIYQLLTPREGILPHLWFLFTLWILCLMVPLFCISMKNKWISLGLAVIMFVLIFLPKATNVCAIGDVQTYAFWFCMGLSLGEKRLDLSKIKPIITCLFIICGGVYLLILLLWEQNQFSWFIYSMLCLIVVVSLAKYAEKSLEKCGRFIGKYSFTIYLLSLPIQNIGDLFLDKLGIASVLGYCVLFLIGLLLPICIAVIVDFIDHKIGNKFVGTIIGL